MPVVGIKGYVEERCVGKLQSIVKYHQSAHIALTEQPKQQHMKSCYTECAVARQNSSIFLNIHGSVDRSMTQDK
jgi:hypothetical protein